MANLSDKVEQKSKSVEKRVARTQRHESLKAMIEAENLQFTYIRNKDEDTEEPFPFGGAVVCWKMPEKANSRMLEVSIAWCHDNERFDKVEGRYKAALDYTAGKRIMFKLLPGPEGMSLKLKEVFLNGFVV